MEQGFEERLLELKGVLTDELNAFEAKRQVSVTMALGIPVSSIENLDVYKRQEEKGIQRSGKVGNAQAKLLDTGKMVEAAVDMLQREPIMLLCGDPCCPCCPARWALMKNLK